MKESLDPTKWWRRAQKDLRSAQLNELNALFMPATTRMMSRANRW
jgi:hypothetical protein